MRVVAPHLDDAVLSCGEWLAVHPGATVVTLFAGTPADGARRTAWDARCGFADAAQAMATRREEDRAALARLHATPVWLDFCDAQYDASPDEATLADALAAALAAPDTGPLLYPLGLFHSDHRLAHAATRRLLAGGAWSGEAWAYEDVPYRGMPGCLQQRLAALDAAGLRATPVRVPRPPADAAVAKRAALDAYASQWRAFGARGLDDAQQPERWWRLAPKDDGDA